MDQSNRGKGRRYDPVERHGQLAIDFEPIEYFGIREAAARSHLYPFEVRFWNGISLSRALLRARASFEYRCELQIALTYLFVKSINDLLAAVLVAKSGYPFQSWPIIRGALEAGELMDYLNRFPAETQAWIDSEQRFDSLSWLRNHLPDTRLRRETFDTINRISHANLKPIAAFSTVDSTVDFNTVEGDAEEVRALVVGPNPMPVKVHPGDLAATIISYPIRVLWQSHHEAIEKAWTKEFHTFDAESKFVFGERWEPSV